MGILISTLIDRFFPAGWQSSLQRTSLQEDTPPGGHASRRTRLQADTPPGRTLLQGGHFSRRTFLQLSNFSGASSRTTLQLKASRRTALQLSASRRTGLQGDTPPARKIFKLKRPVTLLKSNLITII